MPYEFYKALHILFVFAAVTALVGVAMLAATQTTEAHAGKRKAFGILHGVSLLVIFVAGFGLMARIGVGMGGGAGAWPGWIFVKMVIWLLFGLLLAVPRRRPEYAWHVVVLVPLLAATAGAVAVYKPFG